MKNEKDEVVGVAMMCPKCESCAFTAAMKVYEVRFESSLFEVFVAIVA